MLSYKYTPHAKEQMQERGITEGEVAQTVEAGILVGISGTRSIRRRVFTEGYHWLERDYPHKEVQVVYTVEESQIVVITAIARYGRWDGM